MHPHHYYFQLLQLWHHLFPSATPHTSSPLSSPTFPTIAIIGAATTYFVIMTIFSSWPVSQMSMSPAPLRDPEICWCCSCSSLCQWNSLQIRWLHTPTLPHDMVCGGVCTPWGDQLEFGIYDGWGMHARKGGQTGGGDFTTIITTKLTGAHSCNRGDCKNFKESGLLKLVA